MSELEDMFRAVRFAAKLLRDELGPGGIAEDQPARSATSTTPTRP